MYFVYGIFFIGVYVGGFSQTKKEKIPKLTTKMESPKLNESQSRLPGELSKMSTQKNEQISIEKSRSASDDIDKKYIPQMTKRKMGHTSTLSSISDEEKCNSDILEQSSQTTQLKEKSVVETFPWLDDVMKINQKCLGCIRDLKSRNVLNAMDSLIE